MSSAPAPVLRLFHNPACSKSRAALALLQERDVDVEVIEYLKTPPSVPALTVALRALAAHGGEVTQAVRFGEDEAQQRGLRADDDRDLAGWAAVLAETPRLLERPFFVVGDRAVIGRPPELVLTLLPSTEPTS